MLSHLQSVPSLGPYASIHISYFECKDFDKTIATSSHTLFSRTQSLVRPSPPNGHYIRYVYLKWTISLRNVTIWQCNFKCNFKCKHELHFRRIWPIYNECLFQGHVSKYTIPIVSEEAFTKPLQPLHTHCFQVPSHIAQLSPPNSHQVRFVNLTQTFY